MTDQTEEKDNFWLNTEDGPKTVRVGDVWQYGAAGDTALVLERDTKPIIQYANGKITVHLVCRVFRLREQDRSPWTFSNFPGSEKAWRLLARLKDEKKEEEENVK